MSLRTASVKGAKWTSFSTVIVSFIQLLQMLLIAKFLGPYAVGVVGMLNLVVMFGQQFADMGLSNSLIFKKEVDAKQFSSIYWANLFVGILISIITFSLSGPIAAFFNESILENMIKIIALTFILISISQPFQSIIQKKLNFKLLSAIDVISTVIAFAFLILLISIGYEIMSVVISQVILFLLKSILLVFFGIKNIRLHFYFNFIDNIELFKFGLYQLGEKIVNYVTSNLDFIVIGKFLGPESLGFYNLAFNLIIIPASRINPVITKIAFPVLSKINHNLNKFKEGFYELTKYTSLINFPILFGLALVAPLAVPLFLGYEWSNSVVLIQILAIVGLLRSIGNTSSILMMATGRVDRIFYLNIVKFVIQFPLLIVGLILYKEIGVSIAFAIASAINFILNYNFLIKYSLKSTFIEYITFFRKPLLFSILMATVVLITISVNMVLSTSLLFSFVATIFTGAVSYLLLILKSERQMLSLFFAKGIKN